MLMMQQREASGQPASAHSDSASASESKGRRNPKETLEHLIAQTEMQAQVSAAATKSAVTETAAGGRSSPLTGKAGICSDLRRVGKRLPDPNPKPRSCAANRAAERGEATGVAGEEAWGTGWESGGLRLLLGRRTGR